MVRFMNRSIDLFEELARQSNNYFHLNRRGYVFLTGREEKAEEFLKEAEAITALGAGPLRVHTKGSSSYQPPTDQGFEGQPSGADLVLDPQIIQQTFPFITNKAIAMLHTRRCGWLDAPQLGTYLMAQAKAHGMEFVSARVVGVEQEAGRVAGVQVRYEGGGEVEIKTGAFVNCAGPYIQQVGDMLGVQLPVYNELHAKVAIKDSQSVVPWEAPLMLWDDPVHLAWSEEEKAELAGDEEMAWLLEEFPPGVHFKPEGRGRESVLLGLWTYDIKPQEVVWPPAFEPEYAEIVLRGLARMIPGLGVYLKRMGRPVIDGGYYCKTRENRPLIGPLPVEGAYILGAVSGVGIMTSMAGGELLAKHVAGDELPDYAPAFLLSRYQDPAYQKLLQDWESTSGQL
jgi:glycine/D-amino acid oxidase-like deaminating enzyme